MAARPRPTVRVQERVILLERKDRQAFHTSASLQLPDDGYNSVLVGTTIDAADLINTELQFTQRVELSDDDGESWVVVAVNTWRGHPLNEEQPFLPIPEAESAGKLLRASLDLTKSMFCDIWAEAEDTTP